MIIKTITCHEVYNYGASLQEYALLFYLNSNGHNAEAIHYKPDYLSGHFNLLAINNPKYNKFLIKQLYLLSKIPKRLLDLKRKKLFDRFHKKYIPTGSIKYRSNEELKNNIPNADAYICGSDQIWNSLFENGKDPAFYLNFVPNNKIKISYAASFAIDNIPGEVIPLLKKNLSNFHAISVRETSGKHILVNLGIKNVSQVLDPVFLLDYEHWSQFISPIKEDFIFVYDFDCNPIIKDIALKLKKEKGWKIYTVNSKINYADKNFWRTGPDFFVSLIAQSKFNLTNSFHAIAFSIIFQKQFVVVNRNESINTRMRDLLNLINLPRHIITSLEDFEKLNNIDYNSITKLINEHIIYSKGFLKNALK